MSCSWKNEVLQFDRAVTGGAGLSALPFIVYNCIYSAGLRGCQAPVAPFRHRPVDRADCAKIVHGPPRVYTPFRSALNGRPLDAQRPIAK